MKDVRTTKFEVVIVVPDDVFSNGKLENQVEKMIERWKEYAKEYYDKTGIYVSTIANEGKAIYHNEWGCPYGGERTITFNCTPNYYFINDINKYEIGIYYIIGKLKKEFKQHTITVTIMDTYMQYITDDNNDELEEIIKSI